MPDLVMVTGTDTGVGKTWVTSALARALRERGVDVLALKLVESGTTESVQPGEDGVLLADATGQDAPRAALRRYREPVTPSLAAELDGTEVDMPAIEREMLAFAGSHRVTLVEGAGGLLAPLATDCTLLDLAATHGARVLVVAADRLGMLNHTRLTLAALDRAGVTCAGVVVNTIDGNQMTDDHSVGRNIAVLRTVDPGMPLVETTASGWPDTVIGWLQLGS